MNIRNLPATIANGQTKSGAVDLDMATLCGIFLPAAFTGTAITFEGCATETGTFVPVVDGAGASVSKTVAQGQYVYIDPGLLAGLRFVKIVSGSSEGAARTLTLATRIV